MKLASVCEKTVSDEKKHEITVRATLMGEVCIICESCNWYTVPSEYAGGPREVDPPFETSLELINKVAKEHMDGRYITHQTIVELKPEKRS